MTEVPKEESQPEASAKPVHVSIPQTEFKKMESDLEEYKDKYLRQLADMENSRKRMQKERLELLQHSMQSIIVEFLPPIDQLENALKFADQSSNEIKQWAVGFQMISNHLKEVLAGHGVVPFDSIGTAFDPHRHEAVEVVETNDYPAGTVVTESVRGYKMGDKIIRPARVKVAQAPEEPNATPTEDKNEK